MSTVLTPRIRSLPRGISRRNGVLMAVGGGVATVAVAVALASGGDAPAPVTRAAPPTAASTSVDLSVSEQAAVYAALASGDSRLERIAVEVAAGRAGVSALADPRVLHNHGVDTSTRPPARFRSRAAADRFHHR
jgi:hypothetical protein